ncbi:hypothetical protein [Bradyrhizobium sp. CCGUVB14]|uniref:hypothetical protein n=1 Tax=Bradyrhizobium sp. CCGUVB14 TaxID=2949628 RepID=UPI0020B2571C|nr:hypothetical protein [Bradyrhizobium sp. CCGUVB14]MCP3444092.1 hypothetical protein [Bradyrhizobium sp. CCGUVB14]
MKTITLLAAQSAPLSGAAVVVLSRPSAVSLGQDDPDPVRGAKQAEQPAYHHIEIDPEGAAHDGPVR